MIRFAWCWGIIFFYGQHFTGMLLDAVSRGREDKATVFLVIG